MAQNFMNKTIEPDVLPVLQKLKFEGNLATMPKLSRDLYQKVNKVLEMAGGKWSKQVQAHIFPDNAEEVISDAISTGQIFDQKTADKIEFQYFQTPDNIADKLVEMAEIREGDMILEPSAGDGAIVRAIRRKFPIHRLMAIEKDKRHEKSLVNSGATIVHIGDFLKSGNDRYDKIIANPPFRNLQDIEHVRKMHDLLLPGGRLVSITSPAWTFRSDRKSTEFRNWLNGFYSDVEELPPGSFKSSGTNVNTLILSIDK